MKTLAERVAQKPHGWIGIDLDGTLARGITLEGNAKAAAEKAMQLAPVEAQIALAHEIGSNQSYQTYLVTLRQIEASQAVGIKQAEALAKANIKIIANTGEGPTTGIKSVMDLFSAKGGSSIGAAVESLLATTDKAQQAAAVVATAIKPPTT